MGLQKQWRLYDHKTAVRIYSSLTMKITLWSGLRVREKEENRKIERKRDRKKDEVNERKNTKKENKEKERERNKQRNKKK